MKIIRTLLSRLPFYSRARDINYNKSDDHIETDFKAKASLLSHMQKYEKRKFVEENRLRTQLCEYLNSLEIRHSPALKRCNSLYEKVMGSS